MTAPSGSNTGGAGEAPQRAPDQMSINDALMIQELAEGTRIRLRAGGTAEVTANPRDGQWVFVRFIEYPREPERVGTEDLVFCTDVVGLA